MKPNLVLALLLSLSAVPAALHAGDTQADSRIISETDPWSGVWFPPGVARDITVEPYRTEVSRAFADVRVAEEVCAWAQEVRVQDANRQPELRQALRGLCSSVKVGFDARYRAIDRLANISMRPPASVTEGEAQRTWQVNDWLSWRWRRELDIAVPLDPDTRRKTFDTILDSFSATSYQSFDRFGKTLRLLALRPDDDRAAYWLVRMAPRIGANSVSIRPEEALGWMHDRISELAADGDADWLRAIRNLRLYAGDYENALPVAEKLASSNAANARDRIVLALVQEAMGTSGPAAKLQSNCPDPDLLYTETHVASSYSGQFCRDTMMEIAARLQEVQSDSAPKVITQIASGGVRGAGGSSGLKVRSSVLVDRAPDRQQTASEEEQAIIASIEKGETYGHDWNPANRKKEANRLFDEGGLTFDRAVFLIGLAPNSTRFVYAALNHLLRGASAKHDAKRAALRRVLESRGAAKDAGAEEWQRNLAAFDLYDGRFESALREFREVQKRDESPDPAAAIFDRAAIAVLERTLNGDDRPYRSLMANCPKGDEEFMNAYGNRPPDKQAFCRAVVIEIACRTAAVLEAETPVAMSELLEELATVDTHLGNRRRIGRVLIDADPRRAASILRKLATDARGDAMLATRVDALEGMAAAYQSLKLAPEAYAALQLALKELNYQTRSTSQHDWIVLGRMKPIGSADDVSRVLRQRFTIAQADEDLRGMRLALDAMAAHAVETFTGLDAIFQDILFYADTLFKHKRSAEALRVIGYVAPFAKLRGRDMYYGNLESLIRAAGGEEKIPQQSTPWDAQDVPLPKPVPEPATRG